MAPRKKTPRVQAPETSKVSSREYTPVKASTSRNDAQTPAPSTTRGRTDYESVDESPSPGIFSPVNKPTSDIEWAWKSPVGRMGSSANSTKRRLLNKTPVQKTKRCSKANSPLNHFPSKRKLIKVEQDSDHLSILTSQLQALKQCVFEEKNPDTHSRSLSTTPPNSGSSTSTPPNPNKAKEDDNLARLLDDDNYFTLLQCSQYVEEKLIDNPNKTAFSPIYIKPLAKVNAPLNRESASKPSCHSAETIEEHLVSSKKVESNSKTNQQVVIEPYKDEEPSCSDNLVAASVNIVSSSDCTNSETVQKKREQEKRVDTYKFDNNFADDSFDCVLANFCDENVELLSQGKSASQQETPNNVLELSISCEEKRTYLSLSPVSGDVAGAACDATTTKAEACSSTLYSFDDDFLQPDVLKMLDAIECNSMANQPNATVRQREPSPPHQCTPEEIEKKRLEAKLKLAKKKRAAIVETHRLPSRSSIGNSRR